MLSSFLNFFTYQSPEEIDTRAQLSRGANFVEANAYGYLRRLNKKGEEVVERISIGHPISVQENSVNRVYMLHSDAFYPDHSRKIKTRILKVAQPDNEKLFNDYLKREEIALAILSGTPGIQRRAIHGYMGSDGCYRLITKFPKQGDLAEYRYSANKAELTNAFMITLQGCASLRQSGATHRNICLHNIQVKNPKTGGLECRIGGFEGVSFFKPLPEGKEDRLQFFRSMNENDIFALFADDCVLNSEGPAFRTCQENLRQRLHSFKFGNEDELPYLVKAYEAFTKILGPIQIFQTAFAYLAAIHPDFPSSLARRGPYLDSDRFGGVEEAIRSAYPEIPDTHLRTFVGCLSKDPSSRITALAAILR